MDNNHRPLVFALRLFALVDLLALGAVAMPREWMEVLHTLAGLGEMPEGPLVGYLTRSVSVLYAVHGGMIFFISFDVKRYWPLIRLLGVVTIIQGCVVFVIDMAVGMSWPWTLVEAPCFIAAGGMVLITQRLARTN